MATAGKHLNALNVPYRSGRLEFQWNLVEGNRVHFVHNVLVAGGVWAKWLSGGPLLISDFNLPVPRNEFVNLMRRTNDMRTGDPGALYHDDAARVSTLRRGLILIRPGGVAEAERAVRQNGVCNSNPRMTFFDEPVSGRYQRRFNQIFADPRYNGMQANLSHFAKQCAAILAEPPLISTVSYTTPKAEFRDKYVRATTIEKVKLDEALCLLSVIPGQRS